MFHDVPSNPENAIRPFVTTPVGVEPPPCLNVETANVRPATATANAITTAGQRRGDRRVDIGSRVSISAHRSGVRTVERERNRSSRSGIVILQELAQPSTASRQMHLHCS